MSAPESWEDMDAQMNPNGVPRLNANAPSFSFNVNAPMYAPPNPYYPRPPPPHHQQQQPYFHPQFPINNPYIPQPQPQPQFHSRRPYVPPSQSGVYHPPPSDAHAHAHAHNSNNMMMTPPPTATSRSVGAPPPPSHSVTTLPPAAQHSLSKPTETTVTPKEDAHQPQTEEKMTVDSGSAKADASFPQSSSGSGADNEDKIVSGLESLKVTDSNPSKDSDSKNEENVEENYEDSDVEDDEIGSKLHMNVVFIGHVDAGKSTIGGRILFLSNMVDERTIQKYEKEAKEKNRESWYMAYIMDTNEEERAKGITVEVGRAHFETEKKRITILDAPGHKSYVPNMISGASQADVGVLVISARKGEFETGFERGGQTREHAMLAKTLGVCKLICVVNKMDDPSVEWSKERFDDIEKKTLPFLKSCGYNLKKDVQFIPISGLLGANLKERMPRTVCAWWDGPCLFEALDDIVLPPRDPRGPVRMPIIDKFKDMGTVVMGKVESGTIKQGRSLIMMPNKAQVKVVSIYRDNDEVKFAKPGENVRVKLSGVEEEEISAGFVLSSIAKPIHSVIEFDAQLQILELLDHKAIFTAGYKAILHIHSVVEECEITELLHQIDPKTRKPIKRKTLFVKSGAVVMCRIQVNYTVCVEKFSEFPQLGRFTLRDEGKTVAIGKVTNLPKISA